MTLNKTDLLGFAAIIVIVASVLFMGYEITGRVATDTAIVNVTIASNADIEFVQNFVDFGSGAVNTSEGNIARINTEGTVENGTWLSNTNNLVLRNVGNVNVSLTFQSDKTAEDFIGVGDAGFNYKVDGEHCIGNSMSEYTSFETSEPPTACAGFEPTREVDLHVEILIPSEAGEGERTATITATGTTVT